MFVANCAVVIGMSMFHTSAVVGEDLVTRLLI